MNVIVVEDETLILKTEVSMIKKLMPDAAVISFRSAEEALSYAGEEPIDIAFLDINLEVDNGIELAKKLQALNSAVNIIFCTGYSEYSLDALDLYCSAYLMKPITEEKIEKALERLRYPVEEKTKGLFIRCFGKFEVYYNGEPVRFRYTKTKELLACLIDRNGIMLSTREIMVILFEEDGKESYVRNLKSDLVNTFRALGIEDALKQERGELGVKAENICCDYYEYLAGRKQNFYGEYMSQYTLGETTLARLIKGEEGR